MVGALMPATATACWETNRVQPALQAKPGEHNIDRYIAAAAGAPLSGDGLFMLSKTTQHSGWLPEISEGRARELAQAFARTHAPRMGRIFERDRGAPVDVKALRVCGRVFYAVTPFQSAPAELPVAAQRSLGPWWLVTLCGSDNKPHVSLGVSAYSTDLGIRDGRLEYPRNGGNWFKPLGIPERLHGELPVSPERAVHLAATASGRLVAAEPELIAPGPGKYPQTARWRIVLDGPAQFAPTGGGQPVTSTEVFVGVTVFAKPPELTIATPTQPADVEVKWAEIEPGATRGNARLSHRTSRAQRDSSVPVAFVPLTRIVDHPAPATLRE